MHTLTLNEAEGHVRVLLLDAPRARLYAATFSSPARLVVLLIDHGSVTTAAASVGSGGAVGSAGRLSREMAVELSDDGAISCGFLDAHREYAYLGTFTRPAVVLRVELGVNGREPRPHGRLLLNPGEDAPTVALRDGETGYFAVSARGAPRGSPNGTELVRVHLPSLTRANTLRLPSVSQLSAAVVEAAHGVDGGGGRQEVGQSVRSGLARSVGA